MLEQTIALEDVRYSAVIVNTSPLLYLHQIRHLELLQKIYGTLLVPMAVVNELAEGKRKGVDVPEPENISWMKVVSARDRRIIPLLSDLGAGESEVILLGVEYPQSLLIMDDALGRRIARMNTQTVTGTLGVLLKAKQKGYIPEVVSLLRQLNSCGMWISHAVEAMILERAGE